ncbi:hypothetical protein PsYK624_146810 [Phanerochaete sordida]|uniref:Uncharacterized protein n=1 Tax=Phanerochaete sordida TaxID=48140 RepID=A0A9P3GS90_9APHY|nr:hypothetical protein PsYK624_146810 [Phanerochaete sordida]
MPRPSVGAVCSSRPALCVWRPRLVICAEAKFRPGTASRAFARLRSRSHFSIHAMGSIAVGRSPSRHGASNAIPRHTARPIISSGHRSPTFATPSHWQCARRSFVRSMLVASRARSAAATGTYIGCRYKVRGRRDKI